MLGPARLNWPLFWCEPLSNCHYTPINITGPLHITAPASHWSWRVSLPPDWWRPGQNLLLQPTQSHLAVAECSSGAQASSIIYISPPLYSTLSSSPPFHRILSHNCLTRPRGILSRFLRDKTDHSSRKNRKVDGCTICHIIWDLVLTTNGLIEILRSSTFLLIWFMDRMMIKITFNIQIYRTNAS